MDHSLGWGIMISLGITIFQLADINGKLKTCAGLLAECANSLDDAAGTDDDS